MFRTGKIAGYFLLLSFLHLNCVQNKNLVKLIDRNFDEEIELRQNLSFKFDKDLVPDSLINTWDSTRFVKITPEVKGLFRWINSRELVFSPSDQFLPSTAYKAEVTGNVLQKAARHFVLDEIEPVTFHTPFLKLNNANSSWARSSKGADYISMNVSLAFNYKVDPGNIAKLLKVSVNNKLFPFEITSNSAGDNISLKIDGLPKDFSASTQLTLAIDKGLRCLESSYVSSEPLAFSSSVPSPEKLEITHVEGQFVGTEGQMEILSNQPVDMSNISGLIKIEPTLKFSVEEMESGFLLKGLFAQDQTYTINISKKLKGLLGGEMMNDHIATVPFGQLKPSVSFTNSKGIYLSSKSSKKVGINIINMPKVRILVNKIYENNIMSFMRFSRYRNYYSDENNYYSYNDYNTEQFGDVILDQVYETRNLEKKNGISLLNLDFNEHNNYKGVYLVKVASFENQWQKDFKLVSVSDIGLIVKQTDEEVFVFANSILTAQPLPGVKINIISSNNQLLSSAATDGSGIAVFSNIKNKHPNFRVALITAKKDQDFNFLLLADTRVENSRFDVGGEYENAANYKAFIYGDREIYRPGETIHLNTVIRDASWATLSNIPFKIKIILPNGRELLNQKKTAGQQGSFETSVDLAVSTVTGNYIVEVYTSNDVLIGSKNISVEEFIPDRINVVLNADKNSYEQGDTVKAEITALNLFGPPASNRNYEMEFNISKKYFYAKNFPAYNFNIKGTDKITFPQQVKQGKTDADGKAYEKFLVSSEYKNAGMLSGKIFVTVFDETGRPVNRVKNFDIKTQELFYGIRIPDYYVNARSPIQIGLIGVNASGNGLETTARVQIIKVIWHSWMRHRYDDYYDYDSERDDQIISDKTIKLDAKGTLYSFIPNESGQFLVRVMKPGSDKFVESEFYAYSWGYTDNTSFSVNNEGQVEIKFDKEKYKPGDKAKILFNAPFSGKLLVTIERNKVYEHFYMDTDKKTASLSIPVQEAYLPNIYVTATLFRPLDDGSMPLTVAHGFSSMPVEKPEYKLPVTIVAVEKSRSKTKQNIVVRTIPRSDVEVTVAVVDEGIMQLKDSKTPDPHEFFYRKRALEVNAYDVYPFVLPELKTRRSSAAGDGYDLQKRVNPLSNKRVKLVAYWSGILKTNSSGEAICSLDIPQFSGDLRVMAIAYKDKSFGSAEKHIKVADPIVISASMPRFLSPGDSLLLAVTLTNTTEKPVEGSALINATGAVSSTGADQQVISIAANSETRVNFKLAADHEIGEGNAEIVVNAGGVVYSDKTDITVRPAASLLKTNGSGEIAGNKAVTISLQHNFIPSSTDAKLIISKSPLVQFSDQLDYLLDYPHGCIEQTTSIAFPQIYYADLIKSLKNKPGMVVNITRNVQGGISRLFSMQLFNGGLSYWPGDSYECWWGSVYAAHFLSEAKKAGYDVNAPALEKLFGYLTQKVKTNATEEFYYYDSLNKRHRKIIPSKDIFYSLYVLALNGKADLATMNHYQVRISEMALDSRYLLAASYLACGDHRSFYSILPKSFEGEKAVNSFGGNFYSYVRDEAIALNALLTSDPSNPQIPIMVNHISKEIRGEEYLNTQERAFAFLALGKFMKNKSAVAATAEIETGGNKIATFKGEDLVLTKGIAGKDIMVRTTGNGSLFYFWEMEGLSKDGKVKQEDSYLKVRKTFFERFGKQLASNSFRQNDLVVIRLTIDNMERNNVENIVITDMLPAGFEIENPRVAAVPELNWIKDNAAPDYMDIRDDRINYFTSVDYRPKNFYYLVRVVSTGKFIMGPVSADAMYNGEYHSYNGAGVINVATK